MGEIVQRMGCGASAAAAEVCHSRFTFENFALVGNFDDDKERQDLNDVGQALLDERYRDTTELTLSFNSYSQLSDMAAVITPLRSFTALQKFDLCFEGCEQLRPGMQKRFVSRGNHSAIVSEFTMQCAIEGITA